MEFWFVNKCDNLPISVASEQWGTVGTNSTVITHVSLLICFTFTPSS